MGGAKQYRGPWTGVHGNRRGRLHRLSPAGAEG